MTNLKRWQSITTNGRHPALDAGTILLLGGCVKMNKDYHSVILSRAKNLENNSVCIQILHYVQDDIAF